MLHALLSPELQAWATGFPVALLHAGVALLILAAAAALHILITARRELHLIGEGNLAAGISLGSVLAGLAIPLGAAITASASMVDIAVWGISTLLAQLAVFRLIDLLLHDLPQRIVRGEVAAAAVLAGARIGGALVLAAAIGPSAAG